jgi:putative endonuclease
VLDQNWRGPSGEIDLVLRDGDEVVICEVKTRSSIDRGHPHEAVTELKAARLHALAGEWIAAHPEVGGPDRPVRIDLVAVLRPRGSAPRLEHVRGAC